MARSQRSEDAPVRAARPVRRRPVATVLLAWAVGTAVALLVYAPSLGGDFVSDDLHYLPNNPYVASFEWRQIPALLDPRGEPVRLVENYSPVHVFLHAMAWKAFGNDVRGHHAVNVVAHALAAALLGALLLDAGLTALAAWLGAAFFLLHPANVEAVAWMSQLKTTSATVFALLALLLFERRPGWATLAFALALLAKAIAVFALPVAALRWWAHRADGRPGRTSDRAALGWLVAWAGILAAFAAAEFAAFLHATEPVEPPIRDLLGRVANTLAIFGRYLAMAATSWGVSAFHEPDPVRSFASPWVLLGAAGLVAMGARSLVALRAGSEEAAWWAWAVVSFLPVAQVFPFRFPMGDRYLYPILPGLIGGALLFGRAVLSRTPARRGIGLGAAGVAALALVAFAIRAHERAELWGRPQLLLVDAARHYPHGMQAHLLRARRAAEMGDVAGAAAELRAAMARGFDRYEMVLSDPAFAAVRGDPRVQAVLEDMARLWIARLGSVPEPSQAELVSLASAHALLGDRDTARRYLERALERGGPLDAGIREDLALLGAPPRAAPRR